MEAWEVFFHSIFWKNLNKLFGQPNSLDLSLVGAFMMTDTITHSVILAEHIVKSKFHFIWGWISPTPSKSTC